MSIRRLVSKKGLAAIITFLAIIGLSVSLFAESAGGTKIQALDTATHQHGNTTAGSLVDLTSTASEAAYGNNGSVRSNNSETSSSTTVTISESSQSTTRASSSSSQKDISDPDTAPSSNPLTNGSPSPTTHCATCPVPEGGSPAACPDYCLPPTPPVGTGPTPPPVTGCQPCGGLGPTSRSGAIMCAMYCVE